MPSQFAALDTAFPTFTGRESTEQKVEALHNYNYMLLEYLRYILRNLGPENLNTGEMADWLANGSDPELRAALETGGAEGVLPQLIRAAAREELGSDAAALTADRLETAGRVRRYLLGDRTDDLFIRIRDGEQRFIRAAVVSATGIIAEDGLQLQTESGAVLTVEQGQAATDQARNRYGEKLYWQSRPASHTADGYPLDSEGNRVTAAGLPTDWPVTVYRYTEVTEARFAYADGLPQLILGTGDLLGRGLGRVYRDEPGLRLRYVTAGAKNVDIILSEEGFVDAMHRRLASCHVDTARGRVTYTLEGSGDLYALEFAESGDTVTFTWPDGHTCEVTVS